MKDALIVFLLVLVAVLALLGSDHGSNEAFIDDVSAVHRASAGEQQRPNADPDLLFVPCPLKPRNLPVDSDRDA